MTSSKPSLTFASRAKFSSARISPRKVQLTANSIRGKKVTDVTEGLPFGQKRASKVLDKVVHSAVANAVQKGFSKSDLIISDVKLGKGITIGGGRWAAKGRFMPIKKKSTNITVELSVPTGETKKEESK